MGVRALRRGSSTGFGPCLTVLSRQADDRLQVCSLSSMSRLDREHGSASPHIYPAPLTHNAATISFEMQDLEGKQSKVDISYSHVIDEKILDRASVRVKPHGKLVTMHTVEPARGSLTLRLSFHKITRLSIPYPGTRLRNANQSRAGR